MKMSKNSKKKTEQILQAFGEEAFASHIAYVDSFLPEQQQSSPGRFRKQRLVFRRSFKVLILVILLFVLTLTVCSALGIQIFNFHFDQKPGHAFLVRNDTEDGILFYRPTYVVDGYQLHETIDLVEGTRIYVYMDNDGNDYNIQEEQSSDTAIDINTEACDEERLIVGDTEVRLFFWHADESYSAYLSKSGTFIAIHGILERDEILALTESLVPDR